MSPWLLLLVTSTFVFALWLSQSYDFCEVMAYFRSTRLEVFCRKNVLRNFAKFTGKHLCQNLFHCVKSVQIRSFFWSLFSCIRTRYKSLRSVFSTLFTQCLLMKLQPKKELLKKRLWQRYFSENFATFLKAY